MARTFTDYEIPVLKGKNLEWAVWDAVKGTRHTGEYFRAPLPRAGYQLNVPAYTTDWGLTGPLLEEFCIELRIGEDFYFASRTSTGPRDETEYPSFFGSTYLEAICRAIVYQYQKKYTVSIPDGIEP